MSRPGPPVQAVPSIELTERERLLVAIAAEAAAHLVSNGYLTRTDDEGQPSGVAASMAPNRSETFDLQHRPVTPQKTSSPLYVLSHRQREVVRLLAAGKSNREAADILGISPRTVEVHRTKIYQRLDVRNTVSLMRLLLDAGELDERGLRR